MGRTDDVNRSNIEQQARWQNSALIGPLVRLLSSALTTGIIQEGFGYDDLEWTLMRDEEEQHKELAETSRTLLGPNVPVFSINAIRRKLYNEAPLDFPAAEKPFIVTAGGAVFLEDLKPGQNMNGNGGADDEGNPPSDPEGGDPEEDPRS